MQNEKHILYNYVTNILLDRIYSRKLIPLDQPIHLIVSKRETNKFLNENFNYFIHENVKNVHKLDLKIEIKQPFSEKCLQIVDFVCWSIFRKLEFSDESYYKLIKSKIIEENCLFL